MGELIKRQNNEVSSFFHSRSVMVNDNENNYFSCLHLFPKHTFLTLRKSFAAKQILLFTNFYLHSCSYHREKPVSNTTHIFHPQFTVKNSKYLSINLSYIYR